MTFGEMLAFTNRFNEIKNGTSELKKERLKSLSDDLMTSGDLESDGHLKAMFCTVIEEMYV